MDARVIRAFTPVFDGLCPGMTEQGAALRRMLRALENQLRKQKVKRIDTAVFTDNAGAARFYARMGYRELREEKLAKVL